LTASAGVSGWIEFALLRRALAGRIGGIPPVAAYLIRFWGAALLAAAVAWGIKLELGPKHDPILAAGAILIPYGCVYLLLADPAEVRARLGSLAGQR